jgi:hypothetical protein
MSAVDTTTTVLRIEAPWLELSVSVAWDRWSDDRPQFSYVIEASGATATGADLRLGCGAEPRLGDALECLLSFLGAYVEAVRFETSDHCSDNSGLFPDELREWASMVDADAVELLRSELVDEGR